MQTKVSVDEKIIGHTVRYRVPGRQKLMKDFNIVKQHCYQTGIDIKQVEMVIVVITRWGEYELSLLLPDGENMNYDYFNTGSSNSRRRI